MSSKEPRYYVPEPSDINGGWANIGDRESPVYGEPCDNPAGITVYGQVKDGVNTGHKRALEIADILNGTPPPVAAAMPAMTLRQYYKAAALAGLIANPHYGASDKLAAKAAGIIADAMLREDEEAKT